jgi:hypothetical protein
MFSAKKERPRPNDGLLHNRVSLLILVIMVAWFTDDVLRNGKVPFFRDLSTYFYPAKIILARSFQGGEIPFWSRQLGMGVPFLASPQSAVFYPPNMVFVLVPFFSAVRLLFVTHYLVAATGASLLCLRWGTSRPLALLGANLFAFGGVTVSLGNLMDHFQTAVWMPWVLFCIDRCVRRIGSGCRRLPPGAHRVEFLYRPRSFAVGLGVSLSRLCGVILVSVIPGFKRERLY